MIVFFFLNNIHTVPLDLVVVVYYNGLRCGNEEKSSKVDRKK